MAPKLKPMSSCKLEMDSVDGTEGLGKLFQNEKKNY